MSTRKILTFLLFMLLVAVPVTMASLTICLGRSTALEWIFGISFLAVVIACCFLQGRIARLRRLESIRGREALPFDAFYERFYCDRGLKRQFVARALREVSKTLRVPAELLRPSDRFDDELAPPRGFEYEDEITLLDDELEGMRKGRTIPPEIRSILTLDDFIKATAICSRNRRIEIRETGRRKNGICCRSRGLK